MIYLEVIPESIQIVKMDDSTYFSEEYSDYISNSKLSLINPEEGGSSEKFKQGFQGDYSESFELGSAIHGMVLQPDKYEIPEIQKPSGKLGIFSEYVYDFRQKNYSIKDSIELASDKANYYKGKLSPKRLKTAMSESIDFYLKRMKFVESVNKVPLFLSSQLTNKYTQCMSNIALDKKFMKTLYPEGLIETPEVYNEFAILCEIKISGDINKIVKVKAKLDNFTIDYESKVVVLNDLKTTGKPAAWFMGNEVFNELGEKIWIPGSFEKYRYYRQVGMYLWLLQNALSITKGEKFKYRTNILIVETIPDFKTKVFHISKKWIDKGLKEFKELLILASNEY